MTSLPKDAKGKGRATETTPLLANQANLTSTGQASASRDLEPAPEHGDDRAQAPTGRRAFQKTLLNIFLVSLTVVVILFVASVLLVYSYAQRARGVSSDDLERAIIWKGPSSVDVVEVLDDQYVVLNVRGLLGVDTNIVLGFNSDHEQENIYVRWWRDIGRWGVGFLGAVTVRAGQVVAYEAKHIEPLARATLKEFVAPLTANPGEPWDDSWLRPVDLTIIAQPSQDASLLQRFAEESWAKGALDLRMEVDKVNVRGGTPHGRGSWWRGMVTARKTDLASRIRYKLPALPGFPNPHQPLAKLLQLVSYSVIQDDGQLSLYALATIPNPLDSIKLSFPDIPYEVSLLSPPLDPLPISSGTVSPKLTSPNISLPITGRVIPLSSPDSSFILSEFIGDFLSGIPPPIAIRCPLLPNLTIETTFPPPDPPPRVLRDVTIKQMSVSVAPGGGMLASGTIWAKMVLPPGFHLTINVTHVWPDVLVFDGPIELPPEDDDEDHGGFPVHLPHLPLPDLPTLPTPKVPELPWHHRLPTFPGHPSNPKDDPPPLPTPLPARAFARIRPTDWITATTLEPCEGDLTARSLEVDNEEWIAVERPTPTLKECDPVDESGGWTATVTATVEKVPLQVLPGRDKEFRSFINKVLWSRDGAVAGLRGVSGVRSKVAGLLNGRQGEEEPTLELNNLPFEGNVLVGKRGL
uniref:Uncharacterized protein n=1 Tax=Serendipita indica (strain DSM 11827) TaxID=1109443 RepID=G4TT73_SERID|nr:hypothetical protein PIIN_08468 [Serendipita indica DSM 11827]